MDYNLNNILVPAEIFLFVFYLFTKLKRSSAKGNSSLKNLVLIFLC